MDLGTRRFVVTLVLATFAGACGHGGSPAPAPSASASVAAAPLQEERWTEVASDAAPLLTNLQGELPPPETVHRGELLRMGAMAKVGQWNGPLDDGEGTRDGMLFNVQRS